MKLCLVILSCLIIFSVSVTGQNLIVKGKINLLTHENTISIDSDYLINDRQIIIEFIDGQTLLSKTDQEGNFQFEGNYYGEYFRILLSNPNSGNNITCILQDYKLTNNADCELLTLSLAVYYLDGNSNNYTGSEIYDPTQIKPHKKEPIFKSFSYFPSEKGVELYTSYSGRFLANMDYFFSCDSLGFNVVGRIRDVIIKSANWAEGNEFIKSSPKTEYEKSVYLELIKNLKGRTIKFDIKQIETTLKPIQFESIKAHELDFYPNGKFQSSLTSMETEYHFRYEITNKTSTPINVSLSGKSEKWIFSANTKKTRINPGEKAVLTEFNMSVFNPVNINFYQDRSPAGTQFFEHIVIESCFVDWIKPKFSIKKVYPIWNKSDDMRMTIFSYDYLGDF
jgi:hypothetical protein